MTLEILLAEAEAIRAQEAEREPGIAYLDLVGVGWATVDHERALEADLGPLLGGTWLPAPRDELLGASAWRLTGEGSPAVVLLEPDTEGRLAASLARFGEGVAAMYLDGAGRDPGDAVRATPTIRLSRSEPGPLGPARIVLGGPLWGPSILVLERVAT